MGFIKLFKILFYIKYFIWKSCFHFKISLLLFCFALFCFLNKVSLSSPGCQPLTCLSQPPRVPGLKTQTSMPEVELQLKPSVFLKQDLMYPGFQPTMQPMMALNF